jgi:hypothetical protein
MSSKFFGNSLNKNASEKKESNKPKSSGVRKVGRGN